MSTSTTTSDHADPTEDRHHEGYGEHHIDPLWLYLGVFTALVILTAVTVAASYVDFGAANTIIAVLIASIKASLVAFFFMHLRHDKPFHALVLVSGLLFLSFLFLFTLTDEGSRNEVDPANGLTIDLLPTPSAKPAHSGPVQVGEQKPPHRLANLRHEGRFGGPFSFCLWPLDPAPAAPARHGREGGLLWTAGRPPPDSDEVPRRRPTRPPPATTPPLWSAAPPHGR